MSKDGDIVINVPTAHLNLTGYAPEIIVSKINSSIDINNQIPADVKSAVKDFIKEKIQEILENAEQLLELKVPDNFVEIWPIVVEIIKSIIGG